MAMEAIRNAINKSEIVWENIDHKTLTRHVAMVCDRKSIETAGLLDVVPVPKPRTTFHSFASPRNTARATGGDSQFGDVARTPTSAEVKKLIGMMAASSVEACMSHHYYTIDGVIRRQKDGGSI